MRSSRWFLSTFICLAASLGAATRATAAAGPEVTRFLISQPAQARVGEPVLIAATGLAGTVKVFFSDGADPTVEALPVAVDFDRGIVLVRVPAGAHTGPMKIVADGTDSPTYWFRVEP